MKTVLTTLLIFAIAISANGQDLSKEEKKRVKKELKEYIKNPSSYTKKIENYETTIEELETSVDDKQRIVDNQEITISELTEELMAAKAEASKKAAEVEAMTATVAAAQDCESFPSGATYRVQIGLYKEFDITDYFSSTKFVLFENVDGMNRYSIGNFNDPNMAILLKKDLMKMGIKDAFVSEYISGERNTEFSEKDILR